MTRLSTKITSSSCKIVSRVKRSCHQSVRNIPQRAACTRRLLSVQASIVSPVKLKTSNSAPFSPSDQSLHLLWSPHPRFSTTFKEELQSTIKTCLWAFWRKALRLSISRMITRITPISRFQLNWRPCVTRETINNEIYQMWVPSYPKDSWSCKMNSSNSANLNREITDHKISRNRIATMLLPMDKTPRLQAQDA